VWLDDLIRRGLAAAQQDPDGDWERTAARLVDAQAPGLASLVRRIPLTMASGAGWETRTLELVGRLHLLLCAAERLDALPPDVAGDVRTALGWTQSQDEALASAPVADRWLAMAQVIEEEERFRIVRTWLVGERTARRALLLEFAAGDRPLERTIVAGTAFDGELVYYPSRAPLRALIRTGGDIRPLERDPGALGDQTIDDALLRYAEALAANPWVVRWPLILAHVRPAQEGARWFLVDRHDHAVPLRAGFTQSLQLWRLVSVSAGRPITVVVEWDGTAAVPVSAFARPDSAVDLTPGWAA
jgi:hypothetical protein